MPDSTPRQNKYRAGSQPGALLRGALVLKCLCAVLLLLNLLVFYGLVFGSRGWQGYCHRRQLVSKMTSKMQKLEEQNQELFIKIQQLKTDPIAQERAVQEQLGWVHKNEWVIEFPPPKPPPGR